MALDFLAKSKYLSFLFTLKMEDMEDKLFGVLHDFLMIVWLIIIRIYLHDL